MNKLAATNGLKNGLNKLSNLSLPELSGSGLLVFQHGSFGLRAALFKADKSYASIKGFAQSKEVDFTRAIAQVCQQLTKQHGSLPKRCVLISPNAIAANIALPVSPLKPKAYNEMQELIRWEIEGASAQDSKQWLIGSMLVERGYLTSSQREELVTELELRHDQGGDAALVRFGDLAVELGYLSAEQLKECFALQNKVNELEQDLVFGYQAELSESALDSQFSGLSDDILVTANEQQSEHHWLVSGIGLAIRQRWVGAFALNGLKLAAFYPDNGVSFAALGLRTDEQNQYLLEVHASHLVLVQGSHKNAKAITVQARHDGNLSFDEVIKLLPEHISQDTMHLYLYSPEDALDELSFALSEYLNIEVRPLEQAQPSFSLPEGINANYLLPFIGIANHYLGFAEQGRACSVLAKDKEPPLWQKLMQPKVLMATSASIVAIAAFGFLAWMYYNLGIQQQRLAELEEKWDKENKVKQQYSQVAAVYKKLALDIESVQKEIELNQQLVSHLENNVLVARYTVPGTVSAIANAINDGVLIEKVSLQPQHISVEGRALKTRNANEFASELNKNLKPWRYQVGNTDSQIAEQQTADGVFLDYQMRLEIVKRYFVDNDPAKQSLQSTTASKNGAKSE